MRKIFKRERGFSLIELAVVVAIIGILAAIAIPTFLGQREGAQDRQAQSSLRNAVTVARAAAAGTDDSTYPGGGENGPTLAKVLEDAEPSLTFTDEDGSNSPTVVSVRRVDGDTVVLAAYSQSGKCWFVRSTLNGDDAGTYYGVAEDVDRENPGTECDANDVDPAYIEGDSFGDLDDAFSPADGGDDGGDGGDDGE